jgi:large subunit ribosomal protein L19
MIAGVITSPVNMKERADLGIKAGDTVRVWQKIEEKGKTRLQAFEGLVLARKHGSEAGGTFTVRKVSGGIGVEKIFPLYSPVIDKIEIVKRAKVRRAKLYYIREKVAREMRRGLRRMKLVSLSTQSEQEQAAEAQRTAEEEAAQEAVGDSEQVTEDSAKGDGGNKDISDKVEKEMEGEETKAEKEPKKETEQQEGEKSE